MPTAEELPPPLAAKDQLAIMALSARYMRGLDRLDAEELAAAFWPDAELEYGIYSGAPDAFVTFCLEALGSHAANHHFLGQILVEPDQADPDRAFGEVYYQAYHRTVDEAGAPRDLFISGRYIDRYERRGSEWRMCYRSELVDWTRDDAASDQWFVGSPMLKGARKPDDALYHEGSRSR